MAAPSADAEVRSSDLRRAKAPRRHPVQHASSRVEYGLNGWVPTRRTPASRRMQTPMSKKGAHLLAAEAKAAEEAEAAIDPTRRSREGHP
jgi:hypothetical protein